MLIIEALISAVTVCDGVGFESASYYQNAHLLSKSNFNGLIVLINFTPLTGNKKKYVVLPKECIM